MLVREVAELLDRALDVEVLGREQAAGWYGGNGEREVAEAWLWDGHTGAALPPEADHPGAIVVKTSSALTLDSLVDAAVYDCGDAAWLRSAHLRALLERCGFQKIQPWHEARPAAPWAVGGAGGWVKLAVFVPESHAGEVAEALWNAGAGRFERYERCSFRTRGTGTFRGGRTAQPFLGTVGGDETVEEVRLEVAVPWRILARVLAALGSTHPYDEAAYDLYPLLRGPRPASDGVKVEIAGGDMRRLVAELERHGADARVLADSLPGKETLVLSHGPGSPEAALGILPSECAWVNAPADAEDGVGVGSAFTSLWEDHVEAVLRAGAHVEVLKVRRERRH